MSIALPEPTYMRLMEKLARLFKESTPDQLVRAAGVFRAEAELARQLGQDDEASYFDDMADAIATECIAKHYRKELS